MKIITTVGTSLIANNPKSDDFGLESEPYSDVLFDGTKNSETKKDIDNLIQTLKNKASSQKAKASAEIASIEKIDPSGQAEIYLICTETTLSRACAEALRRYFGERVKNIVVVEGLQVSTRKDFEKKGLPELFLEIEKIADNNWDRLLFNITGGYKATIPFMTILAQINRVQMYYAFKDDENGQYELLKMPTTPLDINWSEFEKYQFVWEDLRKGIPNWPEYQIKHQISDDFHSCVWIDDDDPKYALISGLGEAFYKRYLSWTFIHVLQNGPFSVNRNRRRNLNESIAGLQEKLNNFIVANGLIGHTKEQIVEQIRKNGGELDHTDELKGTDVLISKYPIANPEIRLLYSFSIDYDKIKELKIWDFRIENFNHSTYPKEFKEFYQANKNGRWIPYLQAQNF